MITFATNNVHLFFSTLLGYFVSEMLGDEGQHHLFMALGENETAKGGLIILVLVIFIDSCLAFVCIVDIAKVFQVKLRYAYVRSLTRKHGENGILNTSCYVII